MPETVFDGAFWVAVVQIIAIDILLGGDNAVVIALACRRLPPAQRSQGIFWGAFGAIALRILLIAFALQLLALPYLKLVGALLLLWIGVKLLQPEDDAPHLDLHSSTHLLGAIRTIVVADAVMSMDNVVAVAGAAKDSIVLVVFGIAVSVPVIVWGSKVVLKLMDRFPLVIVLGGALLGWIAGEMIFTDAALQHTLAPLPGWLHYASACAGATFVVVVGRWRAQRRQPEPARLVELPLQTPSDTSTCRKEHS